ncbi:MAG: pinensin family lanthipeptide [Cyclobacteriaceae bacterium]
MKKKLTLDKLQLTSFVTKYDQASGRTVKGGGSDLQNPCRYTEPDTCPVGCYNQTDLGCGGGGPQQTDHSCYGPSQPVECTDLYSPCAAC